MFPKLKFRKKRKKLQKGIDFCRKIGYNVTVTDASGGFMSKRCNLNKSKGPQKLSYKKFYNKRFEYCREKPKTRENISFIAFDSCTAINMAKATCHLYDSAFVNRKEKNLQRNLEELKNHSAIKNGNVCDDGKYVLCIVPSVLEEIDIDDKKFSQTIQRHLKDIYLVLDIKPEFKQQFDQLTYKIMKEFKNHGLFIGNHGNFMEADAKNTAQAAIFNLTMASQDDHLTSLLNGQRERIKACSARHLIGDHNAHQAVPMHLCEIMNLIENDIVLPQLENTSFLTDETRKKLEKLRYKPNEYNQKNITFEFLQKSIEPTTISVNFSSSGSQTDLKHAFGRQI